MSERPPAAPSPTETEVWALLASVKDPEIPVISIVDLGIARAVAVEAGRITVTITPTYSGCPAMAEIDADVRRALGDRYGDAVETRVELTLNPAWTTDWISDRGRRQLRDYGIAPPARAAGDDHRRVAVTMTERVRCPRCRSLDSERLSEFGSTACKALYRCRQCLEPFDYFKPL